jgi:hypothetical protein
MVFVEANTAVMTGAAVVTSGKRNSRTLVQAAERNEFTTVPVA